MWPGVQSHQPRSHIAFSGRHGSEALAAEEALESGQCQLTYNPKTPGRVWGSVKLYWRVAQGPGRRTQVFFGVNNEHDPQSTGNARVQRFVAVAITWQRGAVLGLPVGVVVPWPQVSAISCCSGTS